MKLKYFSKKTAMAFFTIFCMVFANFLLTRFMPGDPVTHIVGEDEYFRLEASNPEVIEQIRKEYGLDGSVFHQFSTYVNKTIRLDFGSSHRTKAPVIKTVIPKIKTTLLLAVPAAVIAALAGGFLGLWAGFKKGGFLDIVFSPIMALLQTIPANCLAIVFLLVFAFHLGAFPFSGWTVGGLHGAEKALDVLWHMFLPVTVLTLLKIPSDFMLMKSSVSSIADEDFIVVAMSRGYGERYLVHKQILKNALCPFITSVCMRFGYVLSGSVLIEVVFSWPGMGMLINESVMTKDYPMLQTCFLIMGVCVVVFSLIADALVQMIDPRVREGRTVES